MSLRVRPMLIGAATIWLLVPAPLSSDPPVSIELRADPNIEPPPARVIVLDPRQHWIM